MKAKIHPKYEATSVRCGCGETFTTRSTKETIHIEICSKCHPFYTGKQKFVDAAGRVERFQKRYGFEGQTVVQDRVKKSDEATEEKADTKLNRAARRAAALEKKAEEEKKLQEEATRKAEREARAAAGPAAGEIEPGL